MKCYLCSSNYFLLQFFFIHLHGQKSVGIKVTLAGQISHQKFSQATVNGKIPFFPTQTAKKGSDWSTSNFVIRVVEKYRQRFNFYIHFLRNSFLLFSLMKVAPGWSDNVSRVDRTQCVELKFKWYLFCLQKTTYMPWIHYTQNIVYLNSIFAYLKQN